jgi:hypothetical protein
MVFDNLTEYEVFASEKKPSTTSNDSYPLRIGVYGSMHVQRVKPIIKRKIIWAPPLVWKSECFINHDKYYLIGQQNQYILPAIINVYLLLEKKYCPESKSGYKNLLFRVMKFSGNNFFTSTFLQLLFCLVSFSASGQNGNLKKISPAGNSGNTGLMSITDKQTDYLRSLYSDRVENPKEFINGKEYEPYYLRSEFKPLLLPNKNRTASIFTRTRRYDNLTLQYDTYLDEVIYTDTSKTINFIFPQIALNKDIIDGFNLNFEDESLIFKYFSLPECYEKNLKEGFYEVAYEGKTSYLIKHKSSIYERQGVKNYKYTPENFISKGGVYYKVNSRKSLLRIFAEKSREIKIFLNSEGIKMNSVNKDQILSVVKFYDYLSKSE